MTEYRTWAIVYHYIGTDFETDCLERLFTGTKEDAEKIANECTEITGTKHWIEDGVTTANAFGRD